MTIQAVFFVAALLLLLLFRPATSARVRVEDELRQRAEAPTQTRFRHAFEIGVVALFWLGVLGLWITTLTGWVIERS